MNIFNPDFPDKFVLFSTSHIVTMILIATLWIIIPIVFKKNENEKADFYFRNILAFLLVGQYLGWMLWEAVTGRFTIHLSLPLNLCDTSNFLCAILLINKKYKLYEILYFWALAGTIQSYITPNIYFAFPHYEFFAFYIQHGGEILTILYITIVIGYRPKLSSIGKSISILFAFVLIVYGFNWLTDSNYMFLMADTPQKSTVTKMIALFGEPPRHLIGLGLVVLVSHIVLYLPYAIKDKIAKLKQA